MTLASARRQVGSRRTGALSSRTSDNSVPGSEVKRCGLCLRIAVHTKEVIQTGLTVIRVRYGIPYTELPYVNPADLGRYHLFLLGQGGARAPCPFPRRQMKEDSSGLCNLQRLCRRDRWGLALSISSLKRNLPTSCPTHTTPSRPVWESIATSHPPPADPAYLDHVRRVATGLFPPGWDRTYFGNVTSHVPNASSRFVRGTRADLLWAGRREEFINTALGLEEVPRFLRARYKEVPSVGKKRPLLIFDEAVDLLAPLHRTLYDCIRKKDWVLCGPPTDDRMASTCVNEHQTSVDLVSATDNLDLGVTQVILEAAFRTSLIPYSIRSLAIASLRPLFRGQDGDIQQVSHGQMMGSYLSFPLLCVHSLSAALWAASGQDDARFLVNGDDCVISSSKPIDLNRYPDGYKINFNKTMRARNAVELNSTVFLRQRGGRWREVRYLRRGGCAPDYVGVLHSAAAVRASRAWTDAYVRSRVGRAWGFLPSQLGLPMSSHAAWKRQATMSHSRYHTDLPVSRTERSDMLMIVKGRRSTPVETENVRSLLWQYGREGWKRDVFNPTRGEVRRSFGYRRNRPLFSCLSYVVSDRVRDPRARRGGETATVSLLHLSEEEKSGLRELDLWRQALDSGTAN